MPGDIAAAVGLRTATTGDTLCDEDQPIVLESIDFPGSGYIHRDRAQEQGGPREARSVASEARDGRSVL